MVADDEMLEVPQKSKAETTEQLKRFESCCVRLQRCPTTPEEIRAMLKKRTGEEISNDDAIKAKAKKQKTCIDDNNG